MARSTRTTVGRILPEADAGTACTIEVGQTPQGIVACTVDGAARKAYRLEGRWNKRILARGAYSDSTNRKPVRGVLGLHPVPDRLDVKFKIRAGRSGGREWAVLIGPHDCPVAICQMLPGSLPSTGIWVVDDLLYDCFAWPAAPNSGMHARAVRDAIGKLKIAFES